MSNNNRRSGAKKPEGSPGGRWEIVYSGFVLILLCFFIMLSSFSTMEEAKINIGKRNLVVHSFRHTVISRQLQYLSPQVVRELVGHKSEAMTVNYDGRSFEDRLKQLKQKQKLITKIWH